MFAISMRAFIDTLKLKYILRSQFFFFFFDLVKIYDSRHKVNDSEGVLSFHQYNKTKEIILQQDSAMSINSIVFKISQKLLTINFHIYVLHHLLQYI